MIKHVVAWLIKDTVNTKEENIQQLKQMLEALPWQISQLNSLEVGINFNSSKNSYDIILITSFDSIDDMNIYRNHPEHKKVVDFLNNITDKVIVVDYKTE